MNHYYVDPSHSSIPTTMFLEAYHHYRVRDVESEHLGNSAGSAGEITKGKELRPFWTKFRVRLDCDHHHRTNFFPFVPSAKCSGFRTQDPARMSPTRACSYVYGCTKFHLQIPRILSVTTTTPTSLECLYPNVPP